MYRRRVNPTRLVDVLCWVRYPARTSQICAQAEHYGADGHTRIELSRLPPGIYRDVPAILTVLREAYLSVTVASCEVTNS